MKTLIFAVVPMLAAAAMADAINYSDGGEHDLTVGPSDVTESITLSAQSKLNLNGGNLTVGTSSVQLSGGSKLTVKKGASLLKGTDTAAEKTISIASSTLLIDGGTMTAPAGNHNHVGWGTTHLDGGLLELDNGGSFIVEGAKASFVMDGASLVRALNGSSFILTSVAETVETVRTWAVAGSGGVAVTNSTFTFPRCCLAGNSAAQLACTGSQLLFHNSTVKSLADNIYSRSFYLNGGKWGCRNCVIRFSGSNSSILSPIGFETDGTEVSGNRIEVVDIPSIDGQIRLTSGSSNKYIQKNSTHLMNGTYCKLGGTANEIDIDGGTFGANGATLTFNADASDCRMTIGNGAAATLSAYRDNSIIFTAGASNCKVSVENATLTAKGGNDFGRNCPGCAIELKGATPRISVVNWAVPTTSYVWKLGDESSDLDGKMVALRFVLPAEPYATVPLEANSTLPIKIYPNAQIVVEKGDWTIGTDKTKTFYPLIKDNKSFNGEMTAELVAALNAHATLPEGAALEYDSTTKTLGVRMPRKKLGLFLVVK